VDAITRSTCIDWDEFVATAKATRGATSCYWTFRVADVTAGVTVPPSVMDRLRPPRSAFILRAMERHFVMNLFPVEVACPSVRLDHALWELAVMPRWSGHGEIRPWDEEAEFVVPHKGGKDAPGLPRSERFRRFLASPGYIRTLLRPPR
jgi:hypothetical protein